MQQCLMVMHDDAHGQVLVAFNIWDLIGRSPVSTSHALLVLLPFLHSSTIRSCIFQIHSHIPLYGAYRDKILTPAAR
jgi:hypothetical protein